MTSLIDLSVTKFEKLEKEYVPKKQKFTTLVIDANSLYQEALLHCQSTPKTVHQSIKEFFERLTKSYSQYRIEVIFSSKESFTLQSKGKCCVRRTFDKFRVDENALITWESMREHVLNYERAGGCAYFSREDNFTSMLEFASRDEDDWSKRLLCSADPRFLFASDRFIVDDLFDAVMSERPHDKLEVLRRGSPKPCLWALLRVTDMAVSEEELNDALLSTCFNKANELSSNSDQMTQEMIDKWLEFCIEKKIQFKPEVSELFGKPHMFFYSHCAFEFARVNGKTKGTTLKVLKNSFLPERPILCGPHTSVWRLPLSSNQDILVNPVMSKTVCFNAFKPIRMTFLKYSERPYAVAPKMSDVLQIEKDGEVKAVVPEVELHRIEEEPDIIKRSVEISLIMLKAIGIDEEAIRTAVRMFSGEENSISKKMKEQWKEFQCSIFHVFLAAEMCRNSLFISFPLLGEYQCLGEQGK